MSEKNRLLRIVLIDGYAKNRRNIISVDGGANLNGVNGSGKTSLLQLFPLFYGASPGAIVRKSNVRKSFVRYLLPRPTSYIIFEYMKDGQPVMAVVSSKDDSAVYRFVESGYEDRLFFSDQHGALRPIRSDHLSMSLRDQSIDVTRMFSPEDYRLIIQSARRFHRVGDRDKTRAINDARQRFSLCDPGSDMDHVDLVVKSILDRSTSIGAIKGLLSNILHAESDSTQISPPTDITGRDLSDWRNAERAFRTIRDSTSDIRALERHAAEVRSSRAELGRILAMMRERSAQLRELVQTEQALLEEGREAVERAEAERRHDREAFDTKTASLSSTHAEQQAEKMRIEQSGARFKKRDAAGLLALAEKEPEILEEITSLSGELASLSKGSKSITDQFDALIQKESSRFATASTRIDRLINEAASRRNDRTETRRSAYESEKDSIQRQSMDAREVLNESLALAREELAGHKARIVSPPVPEELQSDLQRARDMQDEAVQERETWAKKHKAARSAYDEAKALRDKGLAFRQQQARSLDEARAAADDIRRIKEAEKGTLIHFLRSEVPGWEETIGKTVLPDLLFRKDLSPSVDPEAPQAIFGVGLSLEGVARVDAAASEDELRQALLDAEQVELAAESALKAADVEQARLEERVNDAERNLRSLNAEGESIARRVQSTREDVQTVSNHIEAKKAEWLAHAKEQVAEAENAVRKGRTAIESHGATIKVSLDKTRSRFDQDVAEIRTECDVAIRSFEDERASIKSEVDERIATLEREKRAALLKEAVDPETLDRLSQRQEDLRSQATRISESRSLLNEYRHFLEHEEPLLPELIQSVSELERELSTARAEAESIDAKHTAAIESIRTRVGSLEKRIAERDQEIEKLDAFIGDNEGDVTELPGESVTIASIDNYDRLHAMFRSTRDRLSSARREGYSIFTGIDRQLRKYPNTPPTDYLELGRSHLGVEVSPHDEWLSLSSRLAKYADEIITNDIGTLITTADLWGQRLREYSGGLRQIHNKINDLGRKATQHTKSVIGNFEMIDDLSVNVRSNLDRLDFWADLNHFATVYDQWRLSRGHSDLPDERFMAQLDSVITKLEVSDPGTDTADRFDVTIEINDQGHRKIARTDHEIAEMSSTGLTYIGLISIYIALTAMRAGDADCRPVIHWTVDELQNLDANNTGRIIDALKQHNIVLVAAYPDPSPYLMPLFPNLYQISSDREIRTAVDTPMAKSLDDYAMEAL